jgi:hypothetical protein
LAHEPLHVFLGDLHAGSKLAPLSPFADADGVQYSPSRIQAVLNGFLAQALADVKAVARGHKLVLHLGGDLVDGVGHHGTTQTVLDWNGQRDLAVQLLLPWVNLADAAYGLLGTDAHVGDNGQQDSAVCKELGVKARQYWPIESAGRKLDWAHHVTAGRRPWTRETALLLLANTTAIECAQRQPPERVPDLIVRHHVHQWAHTRTAATQVVTVPGWQAQTSYTRKLTPNALLTVGVVVWWPARDKVTPLAYEFPADPIVKVQYAKAPTRRVVVTR